MAVPVTDPIVLEDIMSDLEADCERATRKARARLMRLPSPVRRRLDPYGLLLRPADSGPRPPG